MVGPLVLSSEHGLADDGCVALSQEAPQILCASKLSPGSRSRTMPLWLSFSRTVDDKRLNCSWCASAGRMANLVSSLSWKPY